MQKAIDIAKRISKDLNREWMEDLECIGLHTIFDPVYHFETTLKSKNIIIAYIIYAYDPDSQWIDIKHDRWDNKKKILKNLGADVESELFQSIINDESEKLNDIILHYLQDLTTWKWLTICNLINYHSNMIRYAAQKTGEEKSIEKLDKEGAKQSITQDYDIDVITKVNKQKGELLEQAIAARKRADELLDEIRKEFLPTDQAVQADFGFIFTDTAKKKVDIMSWRDFIKERNQRKSRTI